MIQATQSLTLYDGSPTVSPSSSPSNLRSPTSNRHVLLTPQHMLILNPKRLSITLEIKEKHFILTQKALLDLLLLASHITLSLSTGLLSFEYIKVFSALGLDHFLGLYVPLTIARHSGLILSVTSSERPPSYSITLLSCNSLQSLLAAVFLLMFFVSSQLNIDFRRGETNVSDMWLDSY